MLIDQNNTNILAVLGKSFKGSLDGLCIGLVIDDKEILLAVAARGDMLKSR